MLAAKTSLAEIISNDANPSDVHVQEILEGEESRLVP
jgi:hypothetical protein